MSEKQKMLAGDLYLASDPELVADRLRARNILHSYNSTMPDRTAERSQILKDFFGSLGPDHEIEPPFYCDYGYNIHAGRKLYMNFGCVILDCNKVTIGDNVLMGPYVQIYAASHPTDSSVRLSGRELSAPVTIGDNVWIGGGAIILPGVTIGSNTTVGAGSVVTKNVPDHVIAAGNPCKILKQIG